MQQRSDLTFKANKSIPRHNWFTLTPAYSRELVGRILEQYDSENYSVLDPFSGTGTTPLTAASMGFSSIAIEINPFLHWLGNLKLGDYSDIDSDKLSSTWSAVIEYALSNSRKKIVPKMHNIDRWWTKKTVLLLGKMRWYLNNVVSRESKDEYKLLTCAHLQLVESMSNIKRNHQSLSFGEGAEDFSTDDFKKLADDALSNMSLGLSISLPSSSRVILDDSTNFSVVLEPHNLVITSPPYCNRMSYLRELRPFMYWTEFLDQPSEAGQLDWKCVGGTWGVATSKLNDWEPIITLPERLEIEKLKSEIISVGEKNEKKNPHLMAKYVHKYFHDMYLHLQSLKKLLTPNATLHYIVGNSLFYGVHVPTHLLLAEMMRELGYGTPIINTIRKRNSKKGLYEYDITINANQVEY